jgi:hypothetical protein
MFLRTRLFENGCYGMVSESVMVIKSVSKRKMPPNYVAIRIELERDGTR